eukprot:890273-Rhodomonas_salina.1
MSEPNNPDSRAKHPTFRTIICIRTKHAQCWSQKSSSSDTIIIHPSTKHTRCQIQTAPASEADRASRRAREGG